MSSDQKDADPDQSGVSGKGSFPKTSWSLLIDAAGKDPAALADLCKAYWYPIYAFARRGGSSCEDAEDLTQSFFAKMLGSDFLSKADESKGRLRTFLLTAFRNFMHDQRRRGASQKRGGGVLPLAIDAVSAEAWLALEPSDGVTPELEFERSWAREIIRQTREKLRKSYAEAEKLQEFTLLQDHLEPQGGRPYADLAADLGVKEARIRYLIFKLRQRFSYFLKDAVGETVLSHEDAGEELNYLQKIFEDPRPNS